MRHAWVRKSKTLSQCRVCNCQKEMRYSKVVSWRSYFVYILNNKEYSKAPECKENDCGTLNMFEHDKA